jgi:hypothetical protein
MISVVYVRYTLLCSFISCQYRSINTPQYIFFLIRIVGGWN